MLVRMRVVLWAFSLLFATGEKVEILGASVSVESALSVRLREISCMVEMKGWRHFLFWKSVPDPESHSNNDVSQEKHTHYAVPATSHSQSPDL